MAVWEIRVFEYFSSQSMASKKMVFNRLLLCEARVYLSEKRVWRIMPELYV